MRTTRSSSLPGVGMSAWWVGGWVSALVGVCLGVSAQGGCLPRGGVWPGGVFPGGGIRLGNICPEGCLTGLGVCPVGVCLGGICQRGSASGDVCQIPPPPVNRMTDRHFWKYYLAAATLRTVIWIRKCICLTSVTRAKCGVRSTLCWKIPNMSGSIELFAL